jgi:tetrahydromethanopterin S-methyltransferase subunit G
MASDRWGRLYGIVIGMLAVEIAVLWILARAFQ